MYVGPVSDVWFEPDSGFGPGKPVTCKANGYPRPSLHWIRASDNATVSDDEKLVVKSANHSYICIATNEVRGHMYTVMSMVLDTFRLSNAGLAGGYLLLLVVSLFCLILMNLQL